QAQSHDTSNTPANPPIELPSWLTDQSTSQNLPVVQPPSTPLLWEPELVDQPGQLPTSRNGVFGAQNGPVTEIAFSGSDFFDTLQDSNPPLSTSSLKALRMAAKRNYAALVSALQTLGYSIVGFIAAAVVSIDGHPMAQVAVDDLDISNL